MTPAIRSRAVPSANTQALDTVRRWARPAAITAAVFAVFVVASTVYGTIAGRSGADDVRAKLDGVDPATVLVDGEQPATPADEPLAATRALIADTLKAGRAPLDRLAVGFVYSSDPASRITGPVPSAQHDALSDAITRDRTIRVDSVTASPVSSAPTKLGSWSVTLRASTLSGGTATGQASGTTGTVNGTTHTVFERMTWSGS